MWCFVFFFFKQKTAYEMRISDWSSDVCSSDLLLRIRDAARGLSDTVRVAVALNLLTEEGLPHFHRLIATYLGNSGPWRDWNNMWTAEEDRHGCALRDYVRDARLFNMGDRKSTRLNSSH